MLKALQWDCRKYDIYISYNITGEILGRLEIRVWGQHVTSLRTSATVFYCLFIGTVLGGLEYVAMHCGLDLMLTVISSLEQLHR